MSTFLAWETYRKYYLHSFQPSEAWEWIQKDLRVFHKKWIMHESLIWYVWTGLSQALFRKNIDTRCTERTFISIVHLSHIVQKVLHEAQCPKQRALLIKIMIMTLWNSKAGSNYGHNEKLALIYGAGEKFVQEMRIWLCGTERREEKIGFILNCDSHSLLLYSPLL